MSTLRYQIIHFNSCCIYYIHISASLVFLITIWQCTAFNWLLKEVEEFHALSKEIVSLPAKAHFTMVHLDCEELKQGLANKAKNYAKILLEELNTSHREQNLQLVPCNILWQNCPLVFKNEQIFLLTIFLVSLQRICSEFESIREIALKTPENTDDMRQILNYIHSMKTKGIAELNEKIKVNVVISCPDSLVLKHLAFSNNIVLFLLYYFCNNVLLNCALTGSLL